MTINISLSLIVFAAVAILAWAIVTGYLVARLMRDAAGTPRPAPRIEFTRVRITIIIVALCMTALGVLELILNGDQAQLALAVITGLSAYGDKIIGSESKPDT